MKLEFLKNKNIFISGGTGSFGKKMVSFLLEKTDINKIIIYSRDEQKQYKLKRLYNSKKLRFLLGDVRDKERLNFAMQDVDIVIHAAALKHVDMAEYNPFEYIKTNIIGAENIISCALNNKVSKVIALSTDKASSPANLYGATKLLSDKLFVAANNWKGKKFSNTKLSVVRYGNVMGSRGSVVPLFLKQKKEKFFTVTDSSMTRFNITLKEGVEFVIFAIQDMLGGEIFIPKLKSYSLKNLITAISPKAKIKYIGLRPGEKKHEEMISVNDSFNTVEFKKHYVIVPNSENYALTLEKYMKIKKGLKKVKDDFAYNSNTNPDFINSKEISNIIKNSIKDIEY
jgi:UDP-N-acetylglucosamine 4,6-dehydratase/5-epimerase